MSLRSLIYNETSVTECSDGTICENFSSCIPHPYREGSFMCDCFSSHAKDGSKHGQYAGLYCEHGATSICEKGSAGSSFHAFCTNSGECRSYVTKSDQHAGCKCPKGYVGNYCQFIEGSTPTDWELQNFMNPSRISSYYQSQSKAGMSKGAVAGVVLGILSLFMLLGVAFLLHGKGVVRVPNLRKNQKEIDTNENAMGDDSEFVRGKSVYKKRTSTGSFPVTEDTLEADGAILMEAVEEKHSSVSIVDTDTPSKKGVQLEEVNLDDLPSSLDQDHKDDDLPEIA